MYVRMGCTNKNLALYIKSKFKILFIIIIYENHKVIKKILECI